MNLKAIVLKMKGKNGGKSCIAKRCERQALCLNSISRHLEKIQKAQFN